MIDSCCREGTHVQFRGFVYGSILIPIKEDEISKSNYLFGVPSEFDDVVDKGIVRWVDIESNRLWFCQLIYHCSLLATVSTLSFLLSHTISNARDQTHNVALWTSNVTAIHKETHFKSHAPRIRTTGRPRYCNRNSHRVVVGFLIKKSILFFDQIFFLPISSFDANRLDSGFWTWFAFYFLPAKRRFRKMH